MAEHEREEHERQERARAAIEAEEKRRKMFELENNQVQSMFREAILTISLQVPTNKYTIRHKTQRVV